MLIGGCGDPASRVHQQCVALRRVSESLAARAAITPQLRTVVRETYSPDWGRGGAVGDRAPQKREDRDDL